MRVTDEEIDRMDLDNLLWHQGNGEHPTAYISDDLFDRILEDLKTMWSREQATLDLPLVDESMQ